MTLSTPSAGHDPLMPVKLPRRLADVQSDALRLAGLLHIVDQHDPSDSKGQGAVTSLIETAAALAWKITDDLEEVM